MNNKILNKNSFWILSACALSIISLKNGASIPLRIALGCNALILMLDFIQSLKKMIKKSKTEKE
ncbi:MAG: hypothetical protein ACTTK5_01250 [Candidatus Fimenecus sp.]